MESSGHYACQNKEVNKAQIEGFVLEKLSEYVISEKLIPQITAEYNDWLFSQNGESAALLKACRSRLRVLDTDIDSTADLLIKLQSEALISKLKDLEKSKRELVGQIAKLEQQNCRDNVTEDEVRQVFQIIRNQLTSGSLKSVKQVLDTYVQKITVYTDKINIVFNFFPDITLDMSTALTVQNDDEGCAATQPSSVVFHQHSTIIESADDFGAADRTRTGTGLLPRDFKSLVSAIPPRRQNVIGARAAPMAGFYFFLLSLALTLGWTLSGR